MTEGQKAPKSDVARTAGSIPATGAMGTPIDELERRIMDPSFPKNEQEWWARREIQKLRRAMASMRAVFHARG